jgi:integrase
MRSQPGVNGLVFVNTAGHAPHASSFNSQVWARARRATGLEGLRWHDLRHTAVALAVERGAHAKVIQERMGHASVKVTLDRYGHVLPSIEDKIAAGLDQSYHEALAVLRS